MALIKPAFSNFFKNKKLKLYIISISITFGMVISLIYCLYVLNNTLSDKIRNNIINRVLFVSSNEEIDNEELAKISKIENVEYSYRKLVDITMNINNEYPCNVLYTSMQELPGINIGEIFSNDEEVQVILPETYTDRQNNKIDLSNYVGKMVTLSVDELEIEAKVCGVYKNKGYSSSIYINNKFKEKLIEYNELLEHKKSLYVIVDNYKNVENVQNLLKDEFKFNSNISDVSGQSDIKIYNLTYKLIIVILILTLLFNYISISMIIGNIISDEKMDIAIFKAIGYKLKDISKIMKYRIVSIIGISIIVASIISVILNKIIYIIIKYKLDIELSSDYKMFTLLLLVFTIFVYLISLISVKLNNRKIKKINTIELLKEN
jgi:hypothetical protein